LAGLSKGDIVIIDFPFADQAVFKRRPALVIMVPTGDNVVLVKITSQNRGPYPISITQDDLEEGTIIKENYVLPDVIVTTSDSFIHGKVDLLKHEKINEVIDKIVELLKG
jgi:mRNA interferase MazF